MEFLILCFQNRDFGGYDLLALLLACACACACAGENRVETLGELVYLNYFPRAQGRVKRNNGQW